MWVTTYLVSDNFESQFLTFNIRHQHQMFKILRKKDIARFCRQFNGINLKGYSDVGDNVADVC